MKARHTAGVAALWLVAASAAAGEVEIMDVEFRISGKAWDVRAMLRHQDSGWEHYADALRVVMDDGVELGSVIFEAPHVGEDVFKPAIRGVFIPQGVMTVYVEAHDNVHGWSRQRVKVDLTRNDGPRYRVKR